MQGVPRDRGGHHPRTEGCGDRESACGTLGAIRRADVPGTHPGADPRGPRRRTMPRSNPQLEHLEPSSSDASTENPNLRMTGLPHLGQKVSPGPSAIMLPT